jgi:hypothetical protein
MCCGGTGRAAFPGPPFLATSFRFSGIAVNEEVGHKLELSYFILALISR